MHTVVWAFFVACIVAIPFAAWRDNFDIYLPNWLARHNKLIFGALYVAGVAFALKRGKRTSA